MFNKFPVYLLALIMLAACSSDSTENKESSTEKVTKEIADKAVAAIQDPLDKARKATEIVEQHNLQMEEGAQNMEKQ
jgi:hypothetical protein